LVASVKDVSLDSSAIRIVSNVTVRQLLSAMRIQVLVFVLHMLLALKIILALSVKKIPLVMIRLLVVRNVLATLLAQSMEICLAV